MPGGVLFAYHPSGEHVARAACDGFIVSGTPPDATAADRFRLRERTRHWHHAQAERWENARRWPAAAFHLERLHRTDPTVRPRLPAALKQADDTPLSQSTRRNLAATDAARAAAAVADPGPLALGLLTLPSPGGK